MLLMIVAMNNWLLTRPGSLLARTFFEISMHKYALSRCYRTTNIRESKQRVLSAFFPTAAMIDESAGHQLSCINFMLCEFDLGRHSCCLIEF